jgi:type I restriction enzyme S subunit
MEVKWTIKKIGELPIHIGDGNYSNKYPKSSDFKDTGVPFISASDFARNRIDSSNFRFISPEQHATLLKGQLKANDILVVTRGNGVGQVALVDKAYENCNINAQLVLLRADEFKIHAKFLFYLLSSEEFYRLFVSYSSGSAQPQLPIKALKLVQIRFPEYSEQVEIAKVLDSISSKVEINQQTNQTLEQMAQVLFKSWFVDFDPVIDNALAAGNVIPDDLQERAVLRKTVIAQRASNPKLKPLPTSIQQLFPSEFEESELGWIPKGWQIKTINTLNKINPESWTNKTAPEFVKYVDLANAKNGAVLDTTEFTFSEAPSRARRVLKIHDTIIGVVRPANRSFAYINEEGLTGSTGFAVVRAKKESYRAFTYFSLTNDDCIREFARIADGAAYPAIKPDDVAKALCVYSSEQILSQFENLAGQFLLKKSKNEQQLQPLKTIRDTLLPKLISGEVILESQIHHVGGV